MCTFICLILSCILSERKIIWGLNCNKKLRQAKKCKLWLLTWASVTADDSLHQFARRFQVDSRLQTQLEPPRKRKSKHEHIFSSNLQVVFERNIWQSLLNIMRVSGPTREITRNHHLALFCDIRLKVFCETEWQLIWFHNTDRAQDKQACCSVCSLEDRPAVDPLMKPW